MDRNNRYPSSYDNGPNRPPNQYQQQAQQQQYSPQQQHQRQPVYVKQEEDFRRDDYGSNRGGGGGGGGGYRRGGGAMRDQRGGRRHNNDRFNDSRPYNKRPNRPNNFRGGRHNNQDEADQYGKPLELTLLQACECINMPIFFQTACLLNTMLMTATVCLLISSPEWQERNPVEHCL